MLKTTRAVSIIMSFGKERPGKLDPFLREGELLTEDRKKVKLVNVYFVAISQNTPNQHNIAG